MNMQAQNNVEDIYELSPLQQGLLFHALHDPESGIYFMQSGQRMEGLDVGVFLRAWQRLVDRHSVLRTSFHWEGLDRPIQVVHRKVELPVEQLDWRGLGPAE